MAIKEIIAAITDTSIAKSEIVWLLLVHFIPAQFLLFLIFSIIIWIYIIKIVLNAFFYFLFHNETPYNAQKIKTAKYCYLAVFLRSKPLKMVDAAGKRGIKQLIIVFDDAPEQNKELKERGTTDAGRLCLRAVGEPLGVRVPENKNKAILER